MKRKKTTYKQAQVESELHHFIKLLAVEEDIQMRVLVTAMLQHVWDDEEAMKQIVETLKPNSNFSR